MTEPHRLHDPLTGQHLTFLKTRHDTGGKLLQVEVLLEPGGRVPRHVHARQDERVEVLAGALTVTVAGHIRTLNVGESADVPRRKVHVVRNASEGDARFLLEVRPARRMQGAMRVLFAGSNLARILRRRPESAKAR
jgi:quercetin dioxygenase-like cupin family protein